MDNRFSVVSHYKRDGYVVARVCLICDTERHMGPRHEIMIQTLYEVLAQVPSHMSSPLGNIPSLSEGLGGPDGPAWIWYALSCMTYLSDSNVTHEVLSGRSVVSRYQLLEEMFNKLNFLQ